MNVSSTCCYSAWPDEVEVDDRDELLALFARKLLRIEDILVQLNLGETEVVLC